MLGILIGLALTTGFYLWTKVWEWAWVVWFGMIGVALVAAILLDRSERRWRKRAAEERSKQWPDREEA
ncbi:MAG TPA: hypothetical protein VGK43_00395 [Solirubrobacterales bacterium]